MQALGALCVAALGGLTITAYRHPKEYQKLYFVLIIIILVSMWTMVAFNAGNYWAQTAIWGSGVFEYDNASKATDAISNIGCQTGLWCVASGAYSLHCYYDNSPD